MIRIAVLVLLAATACKKETADAGGTKVSETTETTPPVAEDWQPRTGPGFTIEAPGAAAITNVAAEGTDAAKTVHTFRAAPKETWVVEIYELPATMALGRAVDTLRDRLVMSAGRKRNEDYISEGELRGRDLRYDLDMGDEPVARSKILATGTRMFHVRATYPDRNKEREAAADRFVDSFTLTR